MAAEPTATAASRVETWIETYEPEIRRHLLRMTGDGDDTADLLQHVWLASVRNPPPEGTDTNVRAWLYRVATHAALDLLSGRRRRRSALARRGPGADEPEPADAGVPIVEPPGGHAIYIDADAFCSRVEPLELPGIALTVELYREAGIRAVEIGTVMFGRDDPETGEPRPAPHELVRLAIPRRTYTQSHVDYVVEAILNVFERREEMRGYRIVEAPETLRHFTARFEPT